MYPEQEKQAQPKKEAKIEKKWFIWLFMLVVLWLGYISLAQQFLPDDGNGEKVNVAFKAVAGSGTVLDETVSVAKGANALDEMKKIADVKTTSYPGIGAIVTSINGISPGENQFWALYVNNEMSPVGISSITLDQDMEVKFALQSTDTFV
ncbi:MAG: DUF4430 domain-containing protein [Candidatus Diapherotrites archaeon]|uniref:DUF4430 domain-containing protein n=1 Tax=Candidatus Iainarchaeum sp. TaxID=3101447 RepID=A0A938YTR0_9ARCH|nr:DUF4430 domain-containing protein [Candidatus Diapherotrites archaeon]